MCARFTLFTPGDLIAARFNLNQVPDLTPRYNVAPSQQVPVIGAKASGSGRGLALFKWGFVPHWSQDPKSGPKPVNAKSESVADSSAFRDSFRQRRCLIPADGFYEWRTTPEGKMPLHFHVKDRGLFAFAGLWDLWRGESEKLFSCAILTTSANGVVRSVHDRMPVILPADAWDRWLDPAETEPAKLLPLLKPYPEDDLEAEPVDPIINNSRHSPQAFPTLA